MPPAGVSPLVAPRKYAYIDVLRGVAILLVVAVHVSQSVRIGNALAFQLSQFCQIGVQLFFVASALTLCLSMAGRPFSPAETRRFYLRRIFRIAPLYYLGILFYGSLACAKSLSGVPDAAHDYSALNVAANVLFLHGLYPPANNTIVPGGWSIGCEMLFYAAFPWIFQLINSKERAIGLIATTFGTNLLLQIAICLLLKKPVLLVNDSFAFYFITNQLPAFGFGLLLYHACRDSRRPIGSSAISALTAGSLVLLTFGIWQISPFFPLAFAFIPALAGFAFYFLGLCLANLRLNNWPAEVLAEIGRKSFSIYVFHFIFAWDLGRWMVGQTFWQPIGSSPFAFPLLMLLTVAETYGIASITQRLIEEKGVQLGRKWSPASRENSLPAPN